MGCSPTTVTTARDRWLAASETERAHGSWCAPRRPVPRSCPWALSAEQEQAILDARAKSNWGPMRLAWLTGRHRSTCWKVLKRHGRSRRPRGERQTHRRYEWADAGALLHIDALRLAKFDRPGHWATGQRAQEHKTRQAGKTVVIGVLARIHRSGIAGWRETRSAASALCGRVGLRAWSVAGGPLTLPRMRLGVCAGSGGRSRWRRGLLVVGERAERRQAAAGSARIRFRALM
jgi:hypothetical protein